MTTAYLRTTEVRTRIFRWVFNFLPQIGRTAIRSCDRLECFARKFSNRRKHTAQIRSQPVHVRLAG